MEAIRNELQKNSDAFEQEDKNHYQLSEPSQELNVITDTTRNYLKQKKTKVQGVKGRWFISDEKTIVLLIRFFTLFFCLAFWYVVYMLFRAIF